MARLRSEDLDVHALLIGDGAIREDLEGQAERLGVRDRVTFTGRVPRERVPDLLMVMDAGVIPGHEWYCSPIKLFEYGAMGKVVIAFDSPAVREVLVPEEEGLLVGESVDDLARGIRRVVEDPAVAERLGQSLREKVRGRHTWEGNAARVIEAAEEVIGET
ncbi:MAG: glycosyltransferase family 4 protein [Planctomycetota bacterium]